METMRRRRLEGAEGAERPAQMFEMKAARAIVGFGGCDFDLDVLRRWVVVWGYTWEYGRDSKTWLG